MHQSSWDKTQFFPLGTWWLMAEHSGRVPSPAGLNLSSGHLREQLWMVEANVLFEVVQATNACAAGWADILEVFLKVDMFLVPREV
jgi:hypothetical protein